MGLDFTSCVVILVSVRIIRSQLSPISFLMTFSCLPMLVLNPLTFSEPILIPFLLLVIWSNYELETGRCFLLGLGKWLGVGKGTLQTFVGVGLCV